MLRYPLICALALATLPRLACATTVILNENYWTGQTTSLAAWNGPANIKLGGSSPTDTGNSFGVYPTNIGTSTKAQSGYIATFDDSRPTGAGAYGAWDSVAQDWDTAPILGEGFGNDPWAGVWSNGANRTLTPITFSQNPIIVLRTTTWSNIARANSEYFKAVVELTDDSGISGIQFQVTYNANGGASGTRVNRFSARTMAESGANSNVIEDHANQGHSWNGNFAHAITDLDQTVLGQRLHQEYVIRPLNLVNDRTSTFSVEARAANRVGPAGNTAWQQATLTTVGQYTDDSRTSVEGISSFSRIFISALRDGQISSLQTTLPGIPETTAGTHQVGFASISLFLAHPGDFTHDGIVDVADLGILASNWAQFVPTHGQGDADGNGFVNVGDLGAIASGWNPSSSPLSFAEALTLFPQLHAVPEPASLSLLSVSAAILTTRRRPT